MLKLRPLLAPYDHVIWDWNGTLLNDLDAAVGSVNQVLREEALPPISTDHFRATFRFPVRAWFAELGLDVGPENFKRLAGRFHHHFDGALETCALWPGADDVLRSIAAAGQRQTLLSLTEHERLVRQAKRLRVDAHFTEIAGAADLAASSKLARAGEVVARSGVTPARSVIRITTSKSAAPSAATSSWSTTATGPPPAFD